MSGSLPLRQRSASSRSHGSRTSDRNIGYDSQPPPPPGDPSLAFEPCTATASFFLYAQRNVVVCLHHDTLAVERNFDKHREDVLLLSADNISERGAGRQVVSYDAGQTAIVWDLTNGDEIARFASYEQIKVASWMRDGSVAFGNKQGAVILFEPSTSEHTSTRTIFDPITALAPAADCRTFAIGYLNGSIIIATLQPAFTILHTLTTSRGPSPITGLAWHGSSSRQRSEMLATQTSDGDLRVWSIAKHPNNEHPRNIRILGNSDIGPGGKTWFAWSKNGRLVQYFNGETLIWDVRTKRVTSEPVPTVNNVVAIANHAVTATLFTLGHNHMVQQYDLNNGASMVANVQHIPVNAPPTPPDSVEQKGFVSVAVETPSATPDLPNPTPSPFDSGVESSEDEGAMLSPLQKIAHEMDMLEEERRDRLGPLSPVSSRASMSSASSYGRRRRTRDRNPHGSQASEPSDGTPFSIESPLSTPGFDNMSIRTHSVASSLRAASLRPEMPRGSDDGRRRALDLFPNTRARLRKVPFRTPVYEPGRITVDTLRREMLRCVFGWDQDIQELIRDEQSRQRRASPSSILLSKWLGDDGSDQLSQMIGSQSMSSSDWMFLALSGHMGNGSHQVGRAFVKRLLDTDEVHPAVAILLGLGVPNEAVDAYLHRGCYMEAVLLACLTSPRDWRRISQHVRKWAEVAVSQNQAELAARCFSCTGYQEITAVDPPLQDTISPPNSPPSATSATQSKRLKEKNASLKLITDFGDKGPVPLEAAMGLTPIVDSAVDYNTPTVGRGIRSSSKGKRDPSSARTATPNHIGGRREASTGRTPTTAFGDNTPLPGPARGATPMSEASIVEPDTAVKKAMSSKSGALPSPAQNAFTTQPDRFGSQARNPHNLHVDVLNTVEDPEAPSPAPKSASTHGKQRRSTASADRYTKLRKAEMSPALTDTSMKSSKMRTIDKYIESLEVANDQAQSTTAETRSRPQSRNRSRSRPAVSSGHSEPHHIQPAKRSPSSPTAMTTADDVKKKALNSYDDERYYDTTPPVQALPSRSTPVLGNTKQSTSKPNSRAQSPDRFLSSRSYEASSGARSPRSPSVDSRRARGGASRETVGERARARSSSRKAGETRRPLSPERDPRARSSSRKPPVETVGTPEDFDQARDSLSSPVARPSTTDGFNPNRKALAQRELEERRLSLARRPSVPTIPHPEQFSAGLPPREIGHSPTAMPPAFSDHAEFHRRSHTADPENMRNLPKLTGTSNFSIPIGLPATPRAMRHPRYMGADPYDADGVPEVPPLPSQFSSDMSNVERSPENDGLGPLLPSSMYSAKPPPRSMSAPPTKYQAGLHRRKSSQSQQELESGTDDYDVLVVPEYEEDDYVPPMLPELQRLAGPPPPPLHPPPATYHSGVINIAIDDGATSPAPMGVNTAGVSASPKLNRSQRSSKEVDQQATALNASNAGVATVGSPMSITSTGSGNSSKWRITDRLRSNSKQRKQPASEPVVAPYETVLPNSTFMGSTETMYSRQRNGSADHGSMSSLDAMIPPPPPPPPLLPRTTYDGGQKHSKSMSMSGAPGGYRNPKEIRANMPPQELQQGVYTPQGVEGGMI